MPLDMINPILTQMEEMRKLSIAIKSDNKQETSSQIEE